MVTINVTQEQIEKYAKYHRICMADNVGLDKEQLIKDALLISERGWHSSYRQKFEEKYAGSLREYIIQEQHKNYSGEEQGNLQVSCNGLNLDGLDISHGDFSGLLMTNISMRSANMTGVNLSGVDLSNVVLAGATLTGANLEGVKLAAQNIRGAKLNDANLQDVSIDCRVNKEGELVNGRLEYIDFGNSNLTGVTFLGVEPPEESLKQFVIDVSGNSFRIGMNQVTLDNAPNVVIFRNIGFKESVLDGVEFGKCFMSNVDFISAQMEGVNLEGAGCVNVDFTGATLNGASMDRISMINSVGCLISDNHVNMKKADLDRVSLVEAYLPLLKLQGTVLSNVNLTDAHIPNWELLEKAGSLSDAIIPEATLEKCRYTFQQVEECINRGVKTRPILGKSARNVAPSTELDDPNAENAVKKEKVKLLG